MRAGLGWDESVVVIDWGNFIGGRGADLSRGFSEVQVNRSEKGETMD